MSTRYTVRADAVHERRFGVWDNVEDTWLSVEHTPSGSAAHSVVAAGVPMWDAATAERVAADLDLRDALGGRASTADLLTVAHSLTHRMHAPHDGCEQHERHPERCPLRAQRDLVDAEIMRRTALHDMALPDPRLPGLTHVGRERLVAEVAR